MASWNDNRLEVALRASREGIWDWDLENHDIYYSGRVLRFLGYRRKDAPNLFEKRKELMDEASVAEMDEALRRVFGVMVGDVIDTSRKNLRDSGVQSVEEVRALGRPVVAFSPELWRALKEIRAFLFRRMYRAPSVMEVRVRMAAVVAALFPYFLANPLQMPERWHDEIAAALDQTTLARIISDYIAGMTDRFALQLHEQLSREGKLA